MHGCTVSKPVLGACARVEVTAAAPTVPKPASAEDPWHIPPELDRRPAEPQTIGRAPALGPVGDSLDDFE